MERASAVGQVRRRSVLAGLTALASGTGGCLAAGRSPETPPFPPGPVVVAHQGGNLLRPGNTMVAYEHAIAVGADALECDLHRTADGHIVAIHDSTVDRTTNGSGPVDEYTLAELQALDAGYHWSPDGGEQYPYRGKGLNVPTLRAILERFSTVPLLVEIKQATVPPRQLVDLLAETNHLQRTVIASFDDALIQQVRSIAPTATTVLGAREGRQFLLTTRADAATYRPPAEIVTPPYEVVSDSTVDQAHRVGLAVIPWTVNDQAAMERLLNAGVDGLITDDPATAVSTVGSFGNPGGI